jgi:hypothetical protein
MLGWGRRFLVLLVAVGLTVGAYYFLPMLFFGGSKPAPAPAQKAEPNVVYVDPTMDTRTPKPDVE